MIELTSWYFGFAADGFKFDGPLGRGFSWIDFPLSTPKVVERFDPIWDYRFEIMMLGILTATCSNTRLLIKPILDLLHLNKQ